MVWRYCTACFRRAELQRLAAHLDLCDLCRDELAELTLRPWPRPLGGDLQVVSLFRYEGLVRRLVLRAKVHGDQKAVALLLALADGRAVARSLGDWCDAVLPAPSSLWGRLRGRLDLAALLGARMAELAPRPILTAPLHLHWRWRKRALQARGKRHDGGAPLPRRVLRASDRLFERQLTRLPAAERLLLVDDVVTSGVTLRGLAAAVRGAPGRQLRCLTLAAAH